MNAILDPQSLKAAFDDRAEAEAAFVADAISINFGIIQGSTT